MDAAMQELISAGKAAHPELTISEEAIEREIRSRLESPPALEFAGDLYLAAACSLGDRGALALFDKTILTRVAPRLIRNGYSHDLVDEALQIVRAKLFVDGKIRDYLGKGSLLGWVRVAAVRTVLNLQEQRAKFISLPGDEGELILGASSDPELDYLKRRHGNDLREAFRAALSALSVDQRNLLRFQLLHGLDLVEIGRIFGVSRATAARRLAECRDTLLSETKRALGARLGSSESHIESLIAAVRAQLDTNISRLLGRTPEASK